MLCVGCVRWSHNAHFLAFVAMMQGQSQQALECAQTMVAEVPDDFLKDYAPVVDGYLIKAALDLLLPGRPILSNSSMGQPRYLAARGERATRSPSAACSLTWSRVRPARTAAIR